MYSSLTRAEIVETLKKRQLKMSNIETLSQSELLRIYKTFVVPLARREPPLKNRSEEEYSTQKLSQKRPLFVPAAMEVDTPPATPPTIETDTETGAIVLSEKRARHLEYGHGDIHLDDEYLSSAAKRIKIHLT